MNIIVRDNMASQRHLNNAPIIEAVIDIRVNLPPAFNPEEFLSFSEHLSGEYPKNEPRRIFTGAFGIKEDKPFIEEPVIKGIQGYIYKSEDEKNIVQFRIDGFTFSRLNPYTEWQSVFSEAKRLWGLYSSKSSPELITRIAVRYINKLDIPLSMNDFKEYLTAPPEVPGSLPQGISQFLTKIVIHEEDITANIIQMLDKSIKPDHIGVILDIDVFKVKKLGFDKESVLLEFNQLRDFKNRIFFESITEEMARLCE